VSAARSRSGTTCGSAWARRSRPRGRKLQLAAVLSDLYKGARFLWQGPRFLPHPLAGEEGRAGPRHRLDHPAADFLALATRAISGYPPSLYRELLRLAGCEYGDLALLVRRDGMEGALGTILRKGVYPTVDEFKGRQPVSRGSATVEVTGLGLHN